MACRLIFREGRHCANTKRHGRGGHSLPVRPIAYFGGAAGGAGNMLRMAAIRQPGAELVITKDVHIFRVPSGPPEIS